VLVALGEAEPLEQRRIFTLHNLHPSSSPNTLF